MTQTREEFLAALGLPTSGATLGEALAPDTPAKAAPPPETDDRLIPVSDIVFTPDMVDGFDLETQLAGASRVLFERYKSPTRDHDRHCLLHHRISEYLGGLRRERRTGGYIREKIATTAEQRDMAQILATAGVTREQLLAMIPDQS